MNRVVVYDVPNEGKGSLSRDLWVFAYFEDRGLVLDYYAHEERDTPRKKFKARSAYNRLSHNRDYGVDIVTEADAPLPQWVKNAALEQFIATVKVGKWGK